MWSSTRYGGADDQGIIFSTKYDGSGLVVRKEFTTVNPGKPYEGNNPVAYNGKLYSILWEGGIHGDGIISEYDPLTNSYTKKADLHSIGARESESALVVYNSKLYGLSYDGGDSSGGTLFEYNPATNVLIKRHDFKTSTGNGPMGDLVVYNNKLYGIAGFGGANGAGTIFEFNPANNVFTKKRDFLASTTGQYTRGTLIVYNNKLWGVSTYSSGPDGGGYIFSYDPVLNILTGKVELGSINGSTHYGNMVMLNNKFYGAASQGGTNGEGLLFQYDPATNILTKEKDFTTSTAANRFSMIAYNNILYGASMFGGASGDGELFSYNPITNVYSTKITFSTLNGSSSHGRLLLYNSKMYLWSYQNIQNGGGGLKEYNPATNAYVTKVNLGTTDLYWPNGQMMYYNNKLYGTASFGGNNDDGGIFEYDLTTQTYSIKVHLQNTQGQFSDQGSFLLYNNKFYGVTTNGGTNNEGALFEYDPAINTYTKLHDFVQFTGNLPYGKLIEFGGKFYGTTRGGGLTDRGTIFEFNPATNTFSSKVSFDSVRGTNPYAGLTVYGGKIYGVAARGGVHNQGTLFEYLPLANGLIKRADFDISVTGESPNGNLIGYNNKLYGMTYYGVALNGSTLYEYNIATMALTNKVNLTNLQGRMVLSGLTLLNNKFYGMANLGGTDFSGTLFEYDPAIDILTKKQDFVATNGRFPRRSELVPVPAAVAPGSLGSCSNTQTININAANANQWIAFTDAQGRAVGEINANGNILGNTAVRFYINSGSMRQDGNGVYYLDRTITVTPTTQPTTDVSLRLYIRKTEFDNLAATPGSGVSIPSDLNIVKNTDFCASALSAATTPFTSVAGNWGTDYVYSTNASSLGSFYFIGNVAPPTSTLYLRLFIQGYYTGGQLMQSVLLNQGVGGSMFTTDSIDVEIRNVIAPYALVATVRTILQVGGTAVCNFPSLNGSYYIVIKHRQALQTWSANPVMLGALPVSYDFSTASNKAFGNNMFEVETGVWAIYGGDINQDENIDLIDLSILEQDISNFAFGYKATDLNGDGNVDLLDSPILEINVSNFVYSNHP